MSLKATFNPRSRQMLVHNVVLGAIIATSATANAAEHARKAPPTALSNPVPVTARILAPDPLDKTLVTNGRVVKNRRSFTNEQAVVKMFADGRRGLFVQMRTGALPSGEVPVDRMQAACVPVQLTQTATGVAIQPMPGARFVTSNVGQNYRNANKPELMPVNGGKNMLLMYNYRAQGERTQRFAKVLDAACNEVPLTDATGAVQSQVQIMAKEGDDCDMHQSGEGPCDVASDQGGSTHLSCWAGCNGNGQDDGWLNDITVSCKSTPNLGDGATGCQIVKNFDISLAAQEERSRGRVTFSAKDPNTAMATWTEGNTQPQRMGTWMAAVDVSPAGPTGPAAQSRLLWKRQIDGSKVQAGGLTSYSVRAQSTRVLLPNPTTGELEASDMLFFQSGDLVGRNHNGHKGGSYVGMKVAVIQANRMGMNYVVPLTNASDMLLGIDGTHLTMCGAVLGSSVNPVPGFTLLSGSPNGGGTKSPQVKAIGLDLAARKLIDLGTYDAGGSYDSGLYSNLLGQNPGNQGRNFAGCTLIKSPFAGGVGSAQYFVAHALTGKAPDELASPDLKPSSFLTLLPVTTVGAATPEPPAGSTPGNGTAPPAAGSSAPGAGRVDGPMGTAGGAGSSAGAAGGSAGAAGGSAGAAGGGEASGGATACATLPGAPGSAEGFAPMAVLAIAWGLARRRR